MNNHLTLAIVFLLSFSTLSCGTPDWVKTFPSNPQEYVSVISIKKKSYDSPAHYQKAAENQALATIARAISSTITTTSTGITTERNDSLAQSFSQEITAEAQANLSGYTKEVYENRKEYWVYYRLKKTTWARIEQKRLTQSILSAQEHLNAGDTMLSQGNPEGALRHYVDAFRVIQSTLYLHPSIATETGEIPLASLIDAKARQLLTTLYITAKSPLYQGLRADYQKSPPAIVVDYNDAPVIQYPLEILGETYRSDDKGQIFLPYQRVESNAVNALIITSNWRKILPHTDKDSELTKQWISQLPWPRVTTSIEFTRPTIAVTSNEYNGKSKVSRSPLKTKLAEQLTTLRYHSPERSAKANYTIEIQANTRPLSTYQNIHFVYLDITWTLKDSAGNEVTTSSLDPIKGGALDDTQAGLKAYQKGRAIAADAISLWLEQNL